MHMDTNIHIKEVESKKDLQTFIRFQRSLYKNCPHYVPPLDREQKMALQKHPALSFCERRLWLAYKDSQVVGRIAGIINHKYNALKNKKRIRFGWFDMINDVSVAHALISAVEDWGRQEKLNEISGPSRYSNMEKQGMLIDGFDETPSVSAEYNYAYYPTIIEALGFHKEVDYIQYKVKVKEVPDKIKNLNTYISNKYNIKIKEFKHKKELKTYGKALLKALNESYVNIYNFIPLNDEEIDFHIKNNLYLIQKDLVNVLVDENNSLVGFSLCVPSLTTALQKAKGSLFPFGWYHIQKALKKNTRVDMYLTGVLPKWSGSGIHIMYHCKLNEIFIRKGYQYAITNQQLEYNKANRIWEKYDAELLFTRRCYLKNLFLNE